MSRGPASRFHAPRHWALLGVLATGFALLAVRALGLHWEQGAFLKRQGEARVVRILPVNANRGRIRDRNGEILAVSTPVDSVSMDPRTVCAAAGGRRELAAVLGLERGFIDDTCRRHADKAFRYLKRHVPPAVAQRVRALDLDGVRNVREYRRYYPTGPIAAHVVGFTNVDEVGQEGLEKQFDVSLSGAPGRVRMVRDRKGRVVDRVERLEAVRHGSDLDTSLDVRVQYAARRGLARAVERFGAAGASAVVLDNRSGEILAMVNVPDYNPNRERRAGSPEIRNRAVTDLFEPGSTIKPFTVATALDSGRFDAERVIPTGPGRVRIGGHVISDVRDYGDLTVARVLVKSSNVGAARIALELPAGDLLGVLEGIGFGIQSGVELPGERRGVLPGRGRLRVLERATLAFGYGLSVTPVQLARAYAALANGGELAPLTIRKRRRAARLERVLPERVARAVTAMLEEAVGAQGTARRAAVPHYRAAGKTGTSRKIVGGEYADDRHVASFAGFAPASDPRFVMVVVVDDPTRDGYYGGKVAAPVFAEVMAETLRLYNVPPDGVDPRQARRAAASGAGAGA